MKQILLVICFAFATVAQAQQVEKVAPGIWKVTYGTPEKHLPTEFKEAPSTKGLLGLPDSATPPFDLTSIQFAVTAGGAVAQLQLDEKERIYGFGLQVNTYQQRNMRRDIRTNSTIVGNVGFSHAPMPFYISSKGYGILVNTSRYVTFYAGSQHKLSESVDIKQRVDTQAPQPGLSPADLYNRGYKASNEMEIVVRGTEGMEIYVFEGPTMQQVVERYNLYSGGGAMPPMWGLGLKYRAKTSFNDKEVLAFVNYFRKNNIPCDMFGLEPGWQSAAYSCSYVWNKNNFPNPDSVLNVIHGMNYKLNLWEHAYVHPSSPIFDAIAPYSGNYAVWKGAVPDFITPQANKIFADFHEQNLGNKGIASFKLDECDGAYYQEADGEWSFPDIAQFPSGVDGEQMRQIFGLLYQKNLLDIYHKQNKRTLFEVRASHLFAAPYSAAVYSDMYDHADFTRMILNSGFSGLNWSPEVRETKSDADLIRRLQQSLMSSHMVLNCWFLNSPPWFQYNKKKNLNNERLPNYKELEQKAKAIIELRMSLIQYLYAAYARYHYNGTPPFRALVLDYPEDEKTWDIQDQYMMGDRLMCAPFIDGASTCEVYFPAGTWYDFNTGKVYEGSQKYTITMSLDEIPLFVKQGTILPLAEPVQYITPQTVFNITCRIYGETPDSFQLFEDNSVTFDFEKGQYNTVNLVWNKGKGEVKRAGNYKGTLYTITKWEKVNTN